MRKHPNLSHDQFSAVQHITTSPGDIKVVDGLPGTGKTTMINAAKEVWEQAGYVVRGCALAGKAARKLQAEAGIPCHTIAKLLNSWTLDAIDRLDQAEATQLKPNARTILLMDESSMTDTAAFARILKEVLSAGGKIVCIGDRLQLPAIGCGGAFTEIGDRIGKADLTEIRRQKDPRDIEIVKLLSEGNAEEAVRQLDGRGLIVVKDSKADAILQIVSDWKEKYLHTPEQVSIIAGTNEEVAQINRLCQTERLAHSIRNPLLSISVKGQRIYNRDRVMFLKNNHFLGVSNGDCGTVTHVDILKRTITVKHDEKNAPIVVELKRYDQLTVAYAKSTHKEQGNTARHAMVLMGGRMQGKELSFVQVSRHSDTLKIYTDRFEAGPNLEHLIGQIERSHAKLTAHTIQAMARVQESLEVAILPPMCAPQHLEVIEQPQRPLSYELAQQTINKVAEDAIAGAVAQMKAIDAERDEKLRELSILESTRALQAPPLQIKPEITDQQIAVVPLQLEMKWSL